MSSGLREKLQVEVPVSLYLSAAQTAPGLSLESVWLTVNPALVWIPTTSSSLLKTGRVFPIGPGHCVNQTEPHVFSFKSVSPCVSLSLPIDSFTSFMVIPTRPRQIQNWQLLLYVFFCCFLAVWHLCLGFFCFQEAWDILPQSKETMISS